MKDEALSTKFVTPEITCSFPHLAEPNDERWGGKYALSIPLPKSDTNAVAQLKEAMSNPAVNLWGIKYKDLKGVKTFVEDCSTNPKFENDDVYLDCLQFSAKSNRQPGLVYRNLEPVELERIEEVFYPGCIIRVSMNAYATETGGSKTIAFGLSNVMFVRDGERIGGRSSANEDFSEFKDDSFSDDPFASNQAENLFP